MGRAAGDGSHYTFVLRNLSTGKYDSSATISLPSVTSVIGRVLAKPALIPWTYRETRDAISGMVAVHLASSGGHPDTVDDLLDVLADSDALEAYLASNQLRPQDQKDEAAVRGRKAHGALEKMAELALEQDGTAADALANRILDKPQSTPFDRASASWWLDREPEVVATETFLWSLQHGFAGTVDLVWRDNEGALTITDLKSRKAGQPAWESDHIQVGAYSLIWEEQTGEKADKQSVLVVRADGTWDEYVSNVDNEAVFLDLLSVYKELTRR